MAVASSILLMRYDTLEYKAIATAKEKSHQLL